MPLPNTPEGLRDHLSRKLAKRRPEVQVYEDYYQGKHPLAFATTKFREAFGSVFSAFADNWTQLICDSSVERLEVYGFQFGDSSLDSKAQAIWKGNGLQAESIVAHTEAVKTGVAYAMVDPFTTTNGVPQITIERPSQMIVECDPANRRNRLAAYKEWVEGDEIFCTLYTSDTIYKWKADKPNQSIKGQTIRWTVREESFPNPLGAVPVVPLENNPGFDGGVSDLDVMIPLQDSLNKMITDMLVASEYHAYPQRVITGLEIPKDPETGKPIGDIDLKAAVSRFITFKDQNVKVTELSASDLSAYTKAIDIFIGHIAALTRTPPHYLMVNMSNLSSDALIAAETGLNKKVKRKQIGFGVAWEEVIRLALSVDGQAATPGSVTWARSEQYNIAQVADSVTKLATIGIPYEALWEMIGATPEQIATWPTLKNKAATDAAVAQAQTAQETAQPVAA